jgi:hypothetical protein
MTTRSQSEIQADIDLSNDLANEQARIIERAQLELVNIASDRCGLFLELKVARERDDALPTGKLRRQAVELRMRADACHDWRTAAALRAKADLLADEINAIEAGYADCSLDDIAIDG